MAQPRRRLPGLGRLRPDHRDPAVRLALLATDGATSTTVATSSWAGCAVWDASRLVIATVYDPSDGSGDAGRLGLPPRPDALDRLAELHQALQALAAAHGALVADVHARFLDHGLAVGDLPSRPATRP